MQNVEGRLKTLTFDRLPLFPQLPLCVRSSLARVLDARVYSLRGSLVSTKVVVRVGEFDFRDLAPRTAEVGAAVGVLDVRPVRLFGGVEHDVVQSRPEEHLGRAQADEHSGWASR